MGNEKRDALDGAKPSPGSKIEEKVKKYLVKRLLNFFLHDFNIKRRQILNLSFKALITISYLSFWLVSLIDPPAGQYHFDTPLNWFIVFIGGLSILFGGIITDNLVLKKYVFELMSLIAIIPLLMMLYIPGEFFIITGAIILGLILGLLIVQFFTAILVDTNLLNRARVFTFLFFIMGVFSAPIIILIIMVDTLHWVWIIIAGLSLFSMYFSKKYPRRHVVASLKKVENLDVKNYPKLVMSSGAIPYILFIFFTALVIGYFLSGFLEISLDLKEILVIVLVTVISLPLISSFLDNRGRKPMVYLVLFALGVFCIFNDYPSGGWGALPAVKIGIYMFSAILIIILSLVIGGDLSSLFSRGKILGIFIFTTVLGVTLGVTINNYVSLILSDPVIVSDWAAAVIFVATFFFARARETLQEDTQEWRDYLKKLYIISDAGLSLFSRDFSGDMYNKHIENEDLVGGGLKGLESLIKEISESKKRIRVLDHGDTSIIFHYGTYSMGVLFVEKELVIHREKLANFHLLFENLNEDVLKHDLVNINALKDMDYLVERFFKKEHWFKTTG
ncbi:MAG: hypothetical protein ACTSUE_24370 [Promethearchaeota archaeon]